VLVGWGGGRGFGAVGRIAGCIWGMSVVVVSLGRLVGRCCWATGVE